MRFSIRDLLWLMAVVALGATVYADRVQMQRRSEKWAAENAKLQQEADEAFARMKAKADGLRQQNALLQHQLVGLLEKERQRDEEESMRQRSAPYTAPVPRPRPPATASLPDEE